LLWESAKPKTRKMGIKKEEREWREKSWRSVRQRGRRKRQSE